MSLPLIEIDIRWEDTGEEVHDLLVSQYDGIHPSIDDDVVFYYGLTWQEALTCVENKTGPAGSEFVIIDARLIDAPAEPCMDCDSLAKYGYNDGPCDRHKKQQP